MTYLLDTNAVIAVLKNQPASVRHRLRRARSEGASIAVSSVVLYELWYGVARSERVGIRARGWSFLAGLDEPCLMRSFGQQWSFYTADQIEKLALNRRRFGAT